MPPAPAPSPRKHVFKGKKSKHDKAKAQQGFDYPSSKAGTAGGVTVYYQNTLGQQGKDLATRLLQTVQGDYDRLTNWFGGASLGNVNLLIADLGGGGQGGGGAYHYGCQGTDLYCDAAYTGDETAALFVAELAEVAMQAGGHGWDCGASPGEGLSRFVAEVSYPGTLDAYHTADAWLDGDRPDWLNQSDPTDTNAVSTGCAVLALFWAAYKGVGTDTLCQASGSTVAAALTSAGLSPSLFQSDIAAKWPQGTPSGLTSDNPWANGGGGGQGGGGSNTVPVTIHIPAIDVQATLTVQQVSAAAKHFTFQDLQKLILELIGLLFGTLPSSTQHGRPPQ